MKPQDISLLVVDDELELLDVIAELFSSYGFSVDTASSSPMAWELLQRKKYQIVLSDIRMPDGSGLDLIKRLKAAYGNEVSALFMTGFSDLQNEEVYHVGAEGKFSKPFDAKAVRTAIEQSLMAPYVRWNQTGFTAPHKTLLLEKSGENAETLKKQKQAYFGRGGFFIAHNYAPPAKGTVVQFAIQVQKPNPVLFKGYGVVRWIQVPGRTQAPPGLGIEIINMDLATSKVYLQLFGHEIPYIPSLVYAAEAEKETEKTSEIPTHGAAVKSSDQQ